MSGPRCLLEMQEVVRKGVGRFLHLGQKPGLLVAGHKEIYFALFLVPQALRQSSTILNNHLEKFVTKLNDYLEKFQCGGVPICIFISVIDAQLEFLSFPNMASALAALS